jgi:hypothetical protein
LALPGRLQGVPEAPCVLASLLWIVDGIVDKSQTSAADR